eukprot:TRINITY_DN6733_c0_g1_i3.p1 TRINITY_DN6733_c0_g1~~TRINITY_DN6733_c0_g1_i3.p1  ORF type:complete len:127 (-),score=22.78 TRINITY_DN6733_c0_g1_i3:31-411(-)
MSVSSASYWGYKDNNNGTNRFSQKIPQLVAILKNKVKDICLGWIHAGAIDLDGNVWTWGEGDSYRLGHSQPHTLKHLPQPVQNLTLTNKDVIQLSFSRGNEAALTRQGDVYVWGNSDHGGHHSYNF